MCTVVAGRHSEMHPRSALFSQPVDQLIHHSRSMPLPMGSGNEVDVQVGWIFLVRRRQIVIRMMVEIVDLLNPRPTRRIPRRLRKLRTEFRPPLVLVAIIEGSRIERSQSITAYAVVIFK